MRNRAIRLLVLGSAASALAAAVACGSSSGGSAAPPCSSDASPTLDASLEASVDAAGDAGCANCTDAGLVCEAGSVASLGHCTDVAGSLSGLRWEHPCAMAGGAYCPTSVDGGVEVLSATLGGAPGQAYAVTLHLRGVVEQKAYAAGEAGAPQTAGARGRANAQFFVSGGADNGDSFNVYELQVSDPPGTYFLNSGIQGINTCAWWLDYTATIPMTAAATVTLSATTKFNGEVANSNGIDGGPVLVPGVSPYPQAYDGQFIQIDVASVVPMP